MYMVRRIRYTSDGVGFQWIEDGTGGKVGSPEEYLNTLREVGLELVTAWYNEKWKEVNFVLTEPKTLSNSSDEVSNAITVERKCVRSFLLGIASEEKPGVAILLNSAAAAISAGEHCK